MLLEKTPPAIVLGMEITGLAVTRALGRQNIPVIGVDFNHYKIGSLSKYCKRMRCPDPRSSECEFVDSLLSLSKQLPTKGVLFPTNDRLALLISKYRNLLGNYYLFSIPEDGIIEKINNKLEFYHLALKHGIPAPTTYYAEDLDSLKHIAKQIRYPCVIKPKLNYYFEALKIKALKCTEHAELLRNFQRIRKVTCNILIQEVVMGKNDQQFSLCSYLNKDFEPLALFTSRKIRQYPLEFGVGTLVESCYVPEILELGISLLKKLRYCGISEIEFRKDTEDSKFKVIEINTRPWDQIGLAYKSGINLPLIAYNDLVGHSLAKVDAFKTNIKWLRFWSDFRTSFGKSGYLSSGELTFQDWLRSLRGEKDHAIFDWDDPKPFFISFLRGFIKLIKKIFRKNWPLSN